jgi:hypothetical protein
MALTGDSLICFSRRAIVKKTSSLLIVFCRPGFWARRIGPPAESSRLTSRIVAMRIVIFILPRCIIIKIKIKLFEIIPLSSWLPKIGLTTGQSHSRDQATGLASIDSNRLRLM